jgi:hypothetical protein
MEKETMNAETQNLAQGWTESKIIEAFGVTEADPGEHRKQQFNKGVIDIFWYAQDCESAIQAYMFETLLTEQYAEWSEELMQLCADRTTAPRWPNQALSSVEADLP